MITNFQAGMAYGKILTGLLDHFFDGFLDHFCFVFFFFAVYQFSGGVRGRLLLLWEEWRTNY